MHKLIVCAAPPILPRPSPPISAPSMLLQRSSLFISSDQSSVLPALIAFRTIVPGTRMSLLLRNTANSYLYDDTSSHSLPTLSAETHCLPQPFFFTTPRPRTRPPHNIKHVPRPTYTIGQVPTRVDSIFRRPNSCFQDSASKFPTPQFLLSRHCFHRKPLPSNRLTRTKEGLRISLEKKKQDSRCTTRVLNRFQPRKELTSSQVPRERAQQIPSHVNQHRGSTLELICEEDGIQSVFFATSLSHDVFPNITDWPSCKKQMIFTCRSTLDFPGLCGRSRIGFSGMRGP